MGPIERRIQEAVFARASRGGLQPTHVVCHPLVHAKLVAELGDRVHYEPITPWTHRPGWRLPGLLPWDPEDARDLVLGTAMGTVRVVIDLEAPTLTARLYPASLARPASIPPRAPVFTWQGAYNDPRNLEAFVDGFDAVLLHPVDYAKFVGVRRTRVGRWVYHGRAYRTLALALRRVPKEVALRSGGLVVTAIDGVPQGRAYGARWPRVSCYSWLETAGEVVGSW